MSKLPCVPLETFQWHVYMIKGKGGSFFLLLYMDHGENERRFMYKLLPHTN